MRTFWTVVLALVAFWSRIAVAGPATHFSVTVPSTVTGGASFGVTIKALDSANKVDTAYAGTVHLTSSDSHALLPADFSLFLGTSIGQTATLLGTGAQTITATDTVTASINGTSQSINVAANNNPVTHFTVTAPATATAGVAFDITVKAVDQMSQIVTGYTGTVHFTSTDPAAALPADLPLTLGVGSFSVTLMTAGFAPTITVKDAANATISGTCTGIFTSAGAATHFGLSAPATVSAYTSFQISITALDVGGNHATTYAGQAQVTSTDSTALLPAFAPLSNGSGSFPVEFQSIGVFTVTATDTSTPEIHGTSQPIVSKPLVDGNYDPTFGSGGRALVYPYVGLNTNVVAAVRPDGRVVLAGDCNTLDGKVGSTCVVQLQLDGTYDHTFGSGYVNLSGFAGYGACIKDLLAVRVLADGRVLLVGSSCTSQIVFSILKADGSDLDRTVAGGTGWFLDNVVLDGLNVLPKVQPAVQDDGKILVVAFATDPTNADHDDMVVIRWLADLSGRDPAFAPSSPVLGVKFVDFGVNALGATIASLRNGDILLSGAAVVSAVQAPAFARLSNNGSLDSGFGNGGLSIIASKNCPIDQNFAVVDPYGRVVFSCSDTDTLYRTDTAGNLDPTFVAPSALNLSGLALQPDGKVIIIGNDSTEFAKVTRLARNGSLDASFGPGGTVQRTFTDADLGCCGYASDAQQAILGRSGLVVAGVGTAQSGGQAEFGVMRLADDILFGDGFGD